MKLLPFFFLLFCLAASQYTTAQAYTNSERAKMIAEQQEKDNKVKDLFIGREIFVSADIYDKMGKKHRFYKNINNFFVDIVRDGFYFSWDEERGDYSEDVTMVFSYSLKISFDQIKTVASYFSQMRNPIGTEKDYRKVASVVFQAKKGEEFEVFEQTFYVKNRKKIKKESECVKKEFVLIPYASMDINCTTCTHEKLTEKPRNVIMEYLRSK